jgi:hypothetical protein
MRHPIKKAAYFWIEMDGFIAKHIKTIMIIE